MQFTKRDWRNRNRIKTKDGVKWLTIPVEVKGKYLQKILETKIADRTWAKNHWKTIQNNYFKAKHFIDYKECFEDFYLNLDDDLLSTINVKLIKKVCEILGIKTEISSSQDYLLSGDRSEKLVNLCLQTGASKYYSGPAAKRYINEEKFSKSNIDVIYFDYSGYGIYKQLWGKFEHKVSILDLIFNEGANASSFMKSF